MATFSHLGQNRKGKIRLSSTDKLDDCVRKNRKILRAGGHVYNPAGTMAGCQA